MQEKEEGLVLELKWCGLIHVISLAPSKTHYHKSEVELLGRTVKGWVHPFVETISDLVVTNLDQVSDWIIEFLAGKAPEIKDISFIKKTMQSYRSKGYTKDLPMHH